MPVPVITDYFGSQAQVVTALNDVTATIDADNPALIIPLGGMSSTGLGMAGVNYPDSWFFAVLLKVRAFTKADTEDKSMVEVSDPRLNLSERAGLVVEVQDFTVSAYKKRSQVLEFDPDHVNPNYQPA